MLGKCEGDSDIIDLISVVTRDILDEARCSYHVRIELVIERKIKSKTQEPDAPNINLKSICQITMNLYRDDR